MRRRRRGRLQWIALASPSEVAGGRIISFLLMSSTSWEGGESITPLLFSFFPPIFPLLLLAATVATSLRGIYVYYISDKRHNNLPLHTHTCSFPFPLSLSLALCVCFSHTLLLETIFLLCWVYRERQMPCCKCFLRDEFPLMLPEAIKIEA